MAKASNQNSGSSHLVQDERLSRFRMWRSPARLIHPDHHCSHSHEHGRRDRHHGSDKCHDPGRITRQQDSAKRAKTATSSMSKATEGDYAGRPSRSSDRSRTVSSSVSVVGRSRSDGGPMPSRTNGSECHRSSSGERGRRDRGHRSERCHQSSRFHHSTRHRESGEWARPTSSSGESSSRSKQADSTDVPGYGGASGRVTDVRPSTSTHHQHHHSPCPLHLGHWLVVPRLKLRRQRLPAGLPGPVTRRRPFHPASLWWEDPGPTAAQCLPGPTDLNAIDYAVVFGAYEVAGRRDSPRSRHLPRRQRSGERTRPTSSGGSSSRARHVDPTDVQDFPVYRDAVQHSTIHSGAPTEDALQGPVHSSALDYWPEHHSQGSAQASRHVGVHGFAGTAGKTPSSWWSSGHGTRSDFSMIQPRNWSTLIVVWACSLACSGVSALISQSSK